MGCFIYFRGSLFEGQTHNPLIVFKFDVFAKPGKGGGSHHWSNTRYYSICSYLI